MSRLMKAPEGASDTIHASASGGAEYKLSDDGFVLVHERDIPDFLKLGFTLAVVERGAVVQETGLGGGPSETILPAEASGIVPPPAPGAEGEYIGLGNTARGADIGAGTESNVHDSAGSGSTISGAAPPTGITTDSPVAGKEVIGEVKTRPIDTDADAKSRIEGGENTAASAAAKQATGEQA